MQRSFFGCRFKCVFLVVVVATVSLVVLVHMRLIPKTLIFYPYSALCSHGRNPLDRELDFLNENAGDLMKLAKHIIKAHRYSRHGKTIYELNEAYGILQQLLDKTNGEKLKEKTLDLLKFNNETAVIEANERKAYDKIESPEVCPEIYMGMMYGYPYYYTGHKTDYVNCTGQPLGTVFTVLVNTIHDIGVDNLEAILKPLQMYYPNVTALVAHSSGVDDQIGRLSSSYKNFVPIKFDAGKSAGVVWRTLADTSSTQYIFVARQVLRLDNHTSFERLLRFVSYGIVDAVGSSHRYPNGHWFRGCHATAMRNYTLKFVDGYDLSFKSCIYCDYLTGPFVMRRKLFLELTDASLNQETMFVDLFATMTQKSKLFVSCPDVMIEIADRELQSLPRNDWLPFAKKWQFNRIVFTDRSDLRFTCAETDTGCPSTGGLIMPICCIQELIDMMKFIFEMFARHNMPLEIEAGSGVGAAKKYGVIPYERDADFDFDIRHHAKFAAMTPEFKKRGYTLVEEKTDYDKCVNKSSVNCGYFGVKNAHWRIEMWGVNYLGLDEAYRLGLKNKTVVNIDGYWMTTIYSPAETARNAYGDDLYQHVEHWGTLGYGTGWVQPKTGNWLPCPKPGFHGCLNMYLPVGDIQFQDIWI